jgi:hypothetical protein
MTVYCSGCYSTRRPTSCSSRYAHLIFVVSSFRNVDLRELLPEYRIEPSALLESPSTTYDLISNVVHDGEPGK